MKSPGTHDAPRPGQESGGLETRSTRDDGYLSYIIDIVKFFLGPQVFVLPISQREDCL